MTLKVFSPDYLDGLVAQARQSPRLRQYRNIHTDYSDPCQRLFNAIEPASYIRPHRHAMSPRVETMFGIRGRFALVRFSESGEPTDVIPFGANGDHGQLPAGVEVPAGCWHTVLSLTNGAILLEVKAGPFDPQRPKEMAPWAPEEGTPESSDYHGRMKDVVERALRAT